MPHISVNLKKKLKQTFKKFPELFYGGLGKLKGVYPIHLKMVERAAPYHVLPFPIPRAYQKTT